MKRPAKRGYAAALDSRAVFGKPSRRKPKPWPHLPACMTDIEAVMAWHHKRALIVLDWVMLRGAEPFPPSLNPPPPPCTCGGETRTGALLP